AAPGTAGVAFETVTERPPVCATPDTRRGRAAPATTLHPSGTPSWFPSCSNPGSERRFGWPPATRTLSPLGVDSSGTSRPPTAARTTDPSFPNPTRSERSAAGSWGGGVATSARHADVVAAGWRRTSQPTPPAPATSASRTNRATVRERRLTEDLGPGRRMRTRAREAVFYRPHATTAGAPSGSRGAERPSRSRSPVRRPAGHRGRGPR